MKNIILGLLALGAGMALHAQDRGNMPMQHTGAHGSAHARTAADGTERTGVDKVGAADSVALRSAPDNAAKRDIGVYTRPGVKVYHLYISDTLVNYTGKRRPAIAVNGTLPGPTLEFTEGDTAEIYLHNEMMMETSVHWHGILLPNQYDGVSYLTTPPIKAMQTYMVRIPIRQNGTYWYHSHTMLQEQIGTYGAFIIHKRRDGPDIAKGPADGSGKDGEKAGSAWADLPEVTILLSDWTDEKPYEVDRSLHNATDWYAIKKKSTQNYGEAAKKGYFKTKLTNEWQRMQAMDVSDVAYDKFLINGKPVEMRPQYMPGDKVRLRIINGSSSTYFWLNYGGGKMTVVASDGQDVEPVSVDRLIAGVSETYDVVVTIPDKGQYQLQATSEDRTGAVSLWLGQGEQKPAMVLPALHYFEGMQMMNGMMKGNGEMKDMGMHMSNQVMDMNAVMYPEARGGGGAGGMAGMSGPDSMNIMSGPDSMHIMSGMDSAGGSSGMAMATGSDNRASGTTGASDSRTASGSSAGLVTLNYGMLRSPVVTKLPDSPTRVFRFNLTGNMNRYVWTINNKTVSESDEILIHHGENVRIILYNGTMMRHPMHLHGHFFRVLNGQGDYAPLKEVVDILPMETDTIEFAATESGDWFFHCHILYHMMSGMGRIFHYADSPPPPGEEDRKKALRKVYADDRTIHPMARVGLESNGSDGEATLSDTRYRLQTEWRIGTDSHKGYESESHLGRYLGKMQYWMPYIGWDFRYRKLDGPEKNLFGQTDTKDNRKVFCAGVEYLLPMLLVADMRVDMKGKLRLQLRREDVPVTSRLRLTFSANTDKEYMAGLRYILTKYIGISTHYDSDMGWGGGITLNY